MTPIIAVFMSMISLLALVADRTNLQDQQGEPIPLPSVDDGVSRNFLDVAKRTLPLKMTPARAITLRRVPRSAPPADSDGASVYRLRSAASATVSTTDQHRHHGLGGLDVDAVLLQSLLLSALVERDSRRRSAAGPSSVSATGAPGRRPPSTASTQPRDNSLGDLKEDIMVHGRDRDQLRRRWRIENAGNRVASASGHHSSTKSGVGKMRP